MLELSCRRKEGSCSEFPGVLLPQPVLSPFWFPLLSLSFCCGSFILMCLHAMERRERPRRDSVSSAPVPLSPCLHCWHGACHPCQQSWILPGIIGLMWISGFSEQNQAMRSLTPVLYLGRSGCDTAVGQGSGD